MNNYHIITSCCEQEEFYFIIDYYGKYEKLRQFSSYLIQKGLNVVEVGNAEKFLGGNLERITAPTDKLILRVTSQDKTECTTKMAEDISY